jgi:Ca2+-binding EF-hand superfamily protein/voltage-gated potassium channel Kch
MTAGATFDPSIVMDNFATLALGVGSFIVIKAAVLFLAGPGLGLSPAAAARVAITLSGGGEFSLVLFKVAQDLGVLNGQLNDLLIASVIISMSLTPLLGDVADAGGNFLVSNNVTTFDGDIITTFEAEQLFDQIDADKSNTIELDELQIALVERGVSYATIAEIFHAFDKNSDGVISRAEWNEGLEAGLLETALNSEAMAKEAGANIGSTLEIASDAVVICGYTEGGKQIYKALDLAGFTNGGGVVAFELNPVRVSAGVLSGANVIFGNGASPNLLKAAGVTEPRAVIVAYRSESKRLEAIIRLREALPSNTPIYARCVSGQSLDRDELIAAGATDVVDERSEAAVRFTELVSTPKDGVNLARIRSGLMMTPPVSHEYDVVPGISDSLFNDLCGEFKCSREELVDLHKVFSSLPNVDDDRFVEVSELRGILLRSSIDGPVDDKAMERWIEYADSEGSGKLSFFDFARLYYETRQGPVGDTMDPVDIVES